MERGPILLLALGVATTAAGVVRFVHLGHFALVQAAWCLLAIPAALVLVVIADYTLHHARIAFVMMLATLVLLSVISPSFCVGLGIALVGIVVRQSRL